ncbi:MAG: hypothetical protein WKG06_24860 [Segetibacter sp.]
MFLSKHILQNLNSACIFSCVILLAIEKAGDEKSYHPSILLVGQRTSLFNHFNGTDLLDVQIVFQPTAVFRLTGIPAYELTNQHLDATSIFQKIYNLLLSNCN